MAGEKTHNLSYILVKKLVCFMSPNFYKYVAVLLENDWYCYACINGQISKKKKKKKKGHKAKDCSDEWATGNFSILIKSMMTENHSLSELLFHFHMVIVSKQDC